MPSFFMAITITSINPPATKTPIAWDWQGVQALDPLGPQPSVTLNAALTTGTRADGVATTAPTYTVTGVVGLYAPGGAAVNGAATPPTPAPTGGGTGGTGGSHT